MNNINICHCFDFSFSLFSGFVLNEITVIYHVMLCFSECVASTEICKRSYNSVQPLQ